ncbi:transcription repressor NadR [Metallumcola ferriviriculae]|uniref:Transcription repressor NadR n=1 Tax=Metallumcola ferriviriculae TaxID=3039180 RepID=A0AAU0UHE5_9FIRM|nr:transcription repressor NadR [Desulfitibacteraceae bacterium MK1]
MNAAKRREKIVQSLSETQRPITGGDLAESFAVSRQVVVQDIAILRAQGFEILATPQGYIYLSPASNQLLQRTFACQHDLERTQEELNIFVDCGGTVVDVIVEHAIYGQISGSLMLKSRDDVENFCNKIEQSGAALLSSLTEGVHLHTIRSEEESVFDRIERKLEKTGLRLLNEQ